MKLAIGLTALALLAPLPALADPYVMFGGAAGNIDLGDIQSQYGPGADTNDSFSRVIVGIGGRVNRNIGVEASYLSQVTNSVSNSLYRDSLQHSGLQLSLYGYLPVARNIDLFGKVSANYLDTVYETDYGAGDREDKSNVYLGFGGGLEFNLAQNLALRATLEQIQIRSAVDNTSFLGGRNGDFNVNEGSVGLLMYF